MGDAAVFPAAEGWLAFWSGCVAAWSFGLLAWAAAPLAAPVAPAAPELPAPLLVLQEFAMCCIELTARVLPEAVPFCEPELGAAEPEAPVDELPVVPVTCTS